MIQVDQVDALLAVAKKYKYRVTDVHVGVDGVSLKGLVPLAPDVEEEAILAARAKRDLDNERFDEDRRLLGVR